MEDPACHVEEGQDSWTVESCWRDLDSKGGELQENRPVPHYLPVVCWSQDLLQCCLQPAVHLPLKEYVYWHISLEGGIVGMPRCLEHTGVVTQLIREARENKYNLSVLWLDLANSYGSISHKLVQLTLTKHHVPTRVRDLIADYYNNFRMRTSSGAVTSGWHKIEIGIITGCTISVILFYLVMNMLTKSAKLESVEGPRRSRLNVSHR